ncbi:DUF2784 domain-containing protein [Rhodococcus sp. D2-41]|uniref:DUF2784 domain-containing protein n=1 Tax=Speluncibacter jeojiensis TaxID=2710754 RepID=A0A9X4M7Y5_9ACTN|nr:DUF2784 domain-containing protein [Rhodococcus sp. D2-41]MDG3011172.1 DUF2784 domain-containing protein [Rhodococcus sp. D2-41]MDG3015976.1 DUF2784 domain-containing protein [Corynebacteriales bacterium D3-21]
MVYRAIDTLTATVHYAFVLYVVFGGFVAWRWRRTITAHLLAAAWGAGSVLIGFDCPLTAVENWARRRAGESTLDGGFIAHYITGVLYPADALTAVRILAAVTVAVSWAGYLWLGRRGHRRDREADPVEHSNLHG